MTRARTHVVYIAGTGRSGSTALARVLEAHSKAVHVGELRYLWARGVDEDHLCECGERFSGCPFWNEVLSRAYGGHTASVRLSLGALAPRVDRMRHIPQLARAARTQRLSADMKAYNACVEPLYQAARDTADVDYVIDSSKDPSYLFALRTSDKLDLRTVHLVRDSRAVAHSWTRKKVRPEIHWQKSYMNTLPPWRSATLWMEYNAAVSMFRLWNSHTVRVRYEDFATAPEASIERIVAAGVAPRPERTDCSGAGHSLSGNPMRFSPHPMRVKPDNAWTTELATSDRRRVTAITVPLLLAYGYRP